MYEGMRALAAIALFSVLVFTACSKHDARTASRKAEAGDMGEAAGSSATAPADGRAGGVTDPHRKVIRTGRVELVVARYDAARTELDTLLAGAGGYVDSTEILHYQGAVSVATLVLRVPQDAFGALLPRLKQLGEVQGERTNAEDVTDQYVDVSARLASAQLLEKRLLEIASDRAAGVEALLAVERELARVRGEIEGYEGRLRQWNDQIAMSTLTLVMTTRSPTLANADSDLGTEISNGFFASISALQAFGAWLVVTATALLPWLLLFVPAFVLGRGVYRRRFARG